MKVKIHKKDKVLNSEAVIQLLDDYINDSYSGRRTKKNGQRLKKGTISNYLFLKKNLSEFSLNSSFELKLFIVNHLTQTEKERAHRYYKKFYAAFTNYLYKKNYYDNYVGLMIKCLRSFFNYLEIERNISIGTYHRSFYVPKEEIPIIALSYEQLNYIIYDVEFNALIKENDLDKIKDLFVFGCTVAIRVSDLLKLDVKNLIVQGEKYYIKVKSIKSNTYTSIKIPEYAIEILKKYKSKNRLLPTISIAWFNTRLKQFAKLIPDDFELIKTREKRGEQVIIYKNPSKKIHYKLSDHITTHTMRRTAISTMLNLGIPEHMVRSISGHAPNSREFFRYVKLSQSALDKETDKFFNLMIKK